MLARFACLALLGTASWAQSDLNFLSGQVDGRELSQMLPRSLKAKAHGMLAERQRTVEQIRTTEALNARRAYVREKVLAAIGGLPARTPLNARVTAVADRPDHRVEKVIFESQPGFFVTANLYVPKSGSGPFPAILFPLGHEAGAKAHGTWQNLLVTFARRGYVAFAWDTLGQGERIQLWDDDFRESKVIRSTTEHTILGLQALLTGDALARYTIWDGMRALDYLLSRPEVDKTRVGVTGNSGGGTHSAYLGALDDRIHVAAPSCYLTSWGRLLDTIGPQDAEQCMPPFLADGLDHPDFVLAFAPKPYLILSAIRDFFSIQGARSTYAEASRVYDSLGNGVRISRTEADDGHGYSLPRRESAYRWFGKWLKGSEDLEPEKEVVPATEEDLWCTPTGQVATSLGGETVFTLNRKRLKEVAKPFAGLAQVRDFIKYSPRSEPPPVVAFGTLARKGYDIEKLVFRPDQDIVVPALLYKPAGQASRDGVVLVSGQGKAAAHADAEQLALAGHTVLSIDARGYGETRAISDRNGSDWPRYFGDFESSMIAMLTGKPLVAMRAEDVAVAAALLRDRTGKPVIVYGKDGGAVPALYAAAFEPNVSRVWLERMVLSYENVTANRIHKLQWENAVHGVLKHYDLPKLARWMAPREVLLIDPVDAVNQTVKLDTAAAIYPGAKIVRRRSEPLMDLLR